MAKPKQIKIDLGKLKDIYNLIADDKKIIAQDLINEIEFLAETLSRLKELIRNGGVVEQFEQGRQSFMRENPALKSYNTTIQRYSLIYKQLTDLIPKNETKTEQSDGFDEFVSDRDD